jgi:tricorn protease
MWHGNAIYFISDRGSELRMNLWKYDLDKKAYTQLTNFKDYDVHFPSLGPDDIVFEAVVKCICIPFLPGNKKQLISK